MRWTAGGRNTIKIFHSKVTQADLLASQVKGFQNIFFSKCFKHSNGNRLHLTCLPLGFVIINWSFEFILNKRKKKKLSKAAQKTFSPSIGYECCTQKYLTIKIVLLFTAEIIIYTEGPPRYCREFYW